MTVFCINLNERVRGGTYIIVKYLGNVSIYHHIKSLINSLNYAYQAAGIMYSILTFVKRKKVVNGISFEF